MTKEQTPWMADNRCQGRKASLAGGRHICRPYRTYQSAFVGAGYIPPSSTFVSRVPAVAAPASDDRRWLLPLIPVPVPAPVAAAAAGPIANVRAGSATGIRISVSLQGQRQASYFSSDP